MKKERFFIVCLLVVVAILSYLLSISENSNERLIRQIELKDSLSKISTKKDSIFSKKTEEYAKVITKYVSDCNFKYGDKSITTAELLRMTNKAMKDVDLLRDSLDYFKKSNEHYKNLAPEYVKKINSNGDTATAYRALWNQVSKMYDIKGSYTTSENTITTSVERNKKIDSALVLLKYYRHKLSLDSAGTTWTIITDDDKKLKKSNKKGKN